MVRQLWETQYYTSKVTTTNTLDLWWHALPKYAGPGNKIASSSHGYHLSNLFPISDLSQIWNESCLILSSFSYSKKGENFVICNVELNLPWRYLTKKNGHSLKVLVVLIAMIHGKGILLEHGTMFKTHHKSFYNVVHLSWTVITCLVTWSDFPWSFSKV